MQEMARLTRDPFMITAVRLKHKQTQLIAVATQFGFVVAARKCLLDAA